MNSLEGRFPSVCPYSEPPFGEFTDDHVFPDFLGGRRSIRVCRECNNRFGYSFEAKAAEQLKRLQVFVSHFGLDLSRNAATWPAALEIGGVTYDLKSGPNGVQYELARPVIRRDEKGNIVGGRARSRSEAKQFASGLLRRGKAKEVTLTDVPTEDIEDVKLTVALSYNADLNRFATKLASNMAVVVGREDLIKASSIAAYLHGNGGWATRVATNDISAIRKLRPPLSHSVYVEFGPRSHAVVIIFGAIQVYTPLPASKDRSAFIAFLDPITGEESFSEVQSVNIAPPAFYWTNAHASAHFAQIMRAFTNEANARGAKRPPDLRVEFEICE